MSYVRKGTSALLSTVLTLSVLAKEPDKTPSISDYVKTLKYAKIDASLKEEIRQILEKNKLPSTRPEFCPLNNTMTYKQTVDSLKSIVTVFQDDCFDGNQSLIDQILTSSNELEAQLNKLAEEQGKETKDVIPATEDVKIDGIPLTQLMNGMNTLFSNNKCTNLDKTPFLERSADVIQTFAQFGLYSPAGVSVAYGGLAVASILRFINGIFDKRFEFENETDIETFVKLNCAYYDVRNQVRALEMFDIDTDEHYKDKEVAKLLLDEVTKANKAFSEAKEKSLVELEKIKTTQVNNVDKETEKLISDIFEQIKNPIVDLPGKSATYQQAEVLGQLVFIRPMLEEVLTDYINESTGADKFLNILFKNKLAMLDDAQSLMEMTPKDFNSKFLNDISSSFNRVLGTIAKKRESTKKVFDETYTIDLGSEKLTVKEFNELLKSKELEKREKELTTALEKMTELNKRLDTIIAKKEYSSEDSKDGGLREIIKSLDIVKNHVYGKYGKQFIEKMRDLSESQNKNFDEKFDTFKERYFVNESGDIGNLSEDEKLNACVDASTGREIWVYSQKLSELGYDFLATNNDIFGDPDKNKDRKIIKSHNDSAVLARRIITAKNYMKMIANAESFGKTEVEIEGKNLSILEAKEEASTIRFYGKVMTINEAQKYLDKEFGQKGLKNDRIGQIMLEIMNNRERTILLQDFYKGNDCDTMTTITR
ncbi:hypothetical protein [Bacteriovorax sp. Seq25_V]|uniref:hypothetical protein n=1 Tax=Bacteriovorax sp. Seq25_V TaxID=1201288 RepID=UPI00038A175F|nr:hypothetical protein [Bacteriovorax sp. Seq25_V]EQC45292.1 hypothetical protein M900_1862 [Bacteriovorax sp. Seq25_V]